MIYPSVVGKKLNFFFISVMNGIKLNNIFAGIFPYPIKKYYVHLNFFFTSVMKL